MGEGRKQIILVAICGRSPLGPRKLLLAVVCLICLSVIPGLNLSWTTSDNARVVVFLHTFPSTQLSSHLIHCYIIVYETMPVA